MELAFNKYHNRIHPRSRNNLDQHLGRNISNEEIKRVLLYYDPDVDPSEFYNEVNNQRIYIGDKRKYIIIIENQAIIHVYIEPVNKDLFGEDPEYRYLLYLGVYNSELMGPIIDYQGAGGLYCGRERDLWTLWDNEYRDGPDIYINNPFLLRNNIDNPDDPDYQNPPTYGGKKKRKNKSKKTKSKKTKRGKTKKVRKTKRKHK